MEALHALLAFCDGKQGLVVDYPHRGLAMANFYVFFRNKLLNDQLSLAGIWYEPDAHVTSVWWLMHISQTECHMSITVTS